MSRAWKQLRAVSPVPAVLSLLFPLAAAPAAEYVQYQGPALLLLQGEGGRVDADQVEIPLSGHLLLTLRVDGQAPLRVGASGDAVQQEQVKALLASGAWRPFTAAGDQEVRHAREIDDHGLAADGLAEAERQLGGAVRVIIAGQQLAQENLLARGIGKLDADGIASRHHGHACRERAHGAGDVVGEPDHPR